MAASCGRSTSEDWDEGELVPGQERQIADNELSLERLHALFDRMSQKEAKEIVLDTTVTQTDNDFPADAGPTLREVPLREPTSSTLVKKALATTGLLWARHDLPKPIQGEVMDARHTTLSKDEAKALAQNALQGKENKIKK